MSIPSKWLIAIPVIVLWILGIPALVAGRSPVWAAVGLGLFLAGAVPGLAARRALGRWYASDPAILPGQRLITKDFFTHPSR